MITFKPLAPQEINITTDVISRTSILMTVPMFGVSQVKDQLKDAGAVCIMTAPKIKLRCTMPFFGGIRLDPPQPTYYRDISCHGGTLGAQSANPLLHLASHHSKDRHCGQSKVGCRDGGEHGSSKKYEP